MTAALGDGVALLRELVRTDSRNPSLVPGAPGEGRVAQRLADILQRWGFDVRLQEVVAGRPNVVAILRGSSSHRSLMFNGHLDVVGVEGMTHAPFDAVERDGLLYGRGASDMKGGVAVMCAAAARMKGSLRGDIVVAGVVDEEWQSLGTSALLASGVRTTAAIVTEPTGLAMMPAHKGFVWIEVTTHGRAAHGSRWDIGVDAIRHAGLLLAELDRVDAEELPRKQHHLLGRASLHASTIDGGLGLSTYPDRCTLRVERRTIPGESLDDVRTEVSKAVDRIRARRPEFQMDTHVLFAQPPSDVSLDAPICQAMLSALTAHQLSTAPVGMSAWTDAALLNEAGIPAICFGPGDMGLAHAAEEYIPIAEVEQATEVLRTLATEW